jgi:hypothetical protein
MLPMLNAFRIIAEQRITEAIKDGRLNIAGWQGRPLPIEDNRLVPEDLRMAYKVLKNAGFVPPEIETRKAIYNLEELIARTDDEHVRVKQLKKLHFLVMKLDAMRRGSSTLEDQQRYYQQLVERLTVHK